MPVRIADELPARRELETESIFAMAKSRALRQDIRALRIAVLNLMPTKLVTELQLLRLLSNTPLQVDVSFIKMESHESRNAPPGHLDAFYEPLSQILGERFDGLVITGAPVERLPFEEVDYWPELTRLMAWSRSSVWSTLHICWGAQAGLYYHYGIGKYELTEKMSGVFEHTLDDGSAPLARGFDDRFWAPHSRYTAVDPAALRACRGLKLIASSRRAGAYLAASDDGRLVFVTGHPEYDRLTLDAEYRRDLAKGLPIAPPESYYPEGDPSRDPPMLWRAHAHLLYANWLNYCVYQETPYDLGELEPRKDS